MKNVYLLLILTSVIGSFSFYFAHKGKTGVYIATYKDGKTGAYSLIHDDFGAGYAHGIEDYADSIAYNRGIPISFAVIAGECGKEDWNKAKEMIQHGHQVLNHTMKHKCGQANNWCSFGNWDEKDFDVEIDSSTSLIEKNTGKHPAFFIFPFDLFTDTMVAYLKHKHYAGARAGQQNLVHESSIEDPFRLNFTVFRPEQDASVLNSFANEAVQKKSWAIRVVHGVNDESWASISLSDYRAHLDYLKKLSNTHSLWVANLSDVVLYSILRERYAAVVAESDDKERVTKINFALKAMSSTNLHHPTFKQVQATSSLKELTVVIVQDDLTIADIRQGGKKLSYKIREGKLLIEAGPLLGPVIVSYKQ